MSLQLRGVIFTSMSMGFRDRVRGCEFEKALRMAGSKLIDLLRILLIMDLKYKIIQQFAIGFWS